MHTRVTALGIVCLATGTAAAGPATVSWDGPIATSNAYGPRCEKPGAPVPAELLSRLTHGLSGRDDLVILGPEGLTAAHVVASCAPPPREPRPYGFEAQPTPSPQPEVVAVRVGDDDYAFAKASVAGAVAVPARRESWKAQTCWPEVRAMHPDCVAKVPAALPENDDGPCVLQCATRELTGGLVAQRFIRLEDSYYDCTRDYYDSVAKLRVVFGAAAGNAATGNWVQLPKVSGGGSEYLVAGWFVEPGKRARVLLRSEDECKDDFTLQIFAWTPKGPVQTGRVFKGDPGGYISELCLR